MNMYSIYDKKSDSYGSIRLFDNDIIAYRQCKSIIFDTCDKNPFFKEDDFDIIRIGHFKIYGSGKSTPVSSDRFVLNDKEMKEYFKGKGVD